MARATRGNLTLALASAQNRSPSTRPLRAMTSRLMCEVRTCTPSSSRSSRASRRVITSQRRPRRWAATRNLTGALSRDTLVPERSLPVSVPSATTPLAVARKRVIFALIESLDDTAASAEAGTANERAATSAASMTVSGFIVPAGTRHQAVNSLLPATSGGPMADWDR